MDLSDLFKAISTSESVSSLSLSPDGTQLVYTVSSNFKASSDSHEMSALWFVPDTLCTSPKAVQLTSGLWNDRDPAWSADGKNLFFLSDRHKAGGPAQLYQLTLSISGAVFGEPFALTPTTNKSAVTSFRPSWDGRYICYAAAQEELQKDEKDSKDEPILFADPKSDASLYLLSLSTRNIRKIPLGAFAANHVHSFVWHGDSTSLLLLITEHEALEFNARPVQLVQVSVQPNSPPPSKSVHTFIRMPSDLIWPHPETVCVLQGHEAEDICTSINLFTYRLSVSSSGDSRLVDERRRKSGYNIVIDDAMELQDLGRGSRGTFALSVAEGMSTRIEVHAGTASEPSKSVKRLYAAGGKGTSDWSLREHADASKGSTYVLAAVVSSTTVSWRIAPNVHIGTVNIEEVGSRKTSELRLERQASSHYAWIEEMDAKFGRNVGEVVSWKGEDGQTLEGLAVWGTTKDRPKLPEAKMKTILLPHGGPYARSVPDISSSFFFLRDVLAWTGWLVLCPNYRGSSGRGPKFARPSPLTGSQDWSDTYSLLNYTIEAGTTDPSRCAIAGWSQGGYLSAFGITQDTKGLFKAAVVGAGVSEWGAMAAESDLPDFEADLGGSAPWTPLDPNTPLPHHRPSPMRYLSAVKAPVLIIHGAKDQRVPCSQGVMLHRGLRRVAKQVPSERHELVIYPREGHGFKEQKHVIDVLKRTIDHLETWVR